ncbi:Copper-resistance protein [Trema orientale]|uniref:Copper-resistance protein n=1 Tax=Trema orientale TaxID=63057 RepID=A0A2P5FLI5_TREOI|nr:Copper-resistance protein [Trema orientale]
MASSADARQRFFLCVIFHSVLLAFYVAEGENLSFEWHVAIDNTIKPVSVDQPVITINGMFPGPLINASTNDEIHVNVFNDIADEPLLMTWNGIQQRLNSWQDGVSGTNCPIQPGKNWTYIFQLKDQIGGFFYFPSINFQKAGGGFGPIRVNNREVISVPFPKPDAEFDLLIGDWYQKSYKDVRSSLNSIITAYITYPDGILMNGKGPYMDPHTKVHESFTVTKGKTYRIRISNVGTSWSFNFRIQNHRMELVETEGSYTNQMMLDSLDVHVGQSYSVLVTADQDAADYYIVASPTMYDSGRYGIGVLHYDNSTTPATGPLPSGPDPFDAEFSINQARSIRWNMTAGAARPNPQGTFNVTNVTISQTFILGSSSADIGGVTHYTVNNVAYLTPETPLKLADHFANTSGVFELDEFSTNSTNSNSELGTFVASGTHKGWIELVFQNGFDDMDSWHLDGFSFYVVGFGFAEWSSELRTTYNLYDPVVRSTVQVYPGSWTAVYAYLDNPGMWNLRSQNLKNWYLGQELYVRVYDADPNPAKERPAPEDLLLCGKFGPQAPAPPPAYSGPPSSASTLQSAW